MQLHASNEQGIVFLWRGFEIWMKQYMFHLMVLVRHEAKQMVADQLSCINVQRSWQCVEPTILVSLRAIQSLARSAKPLILVSSLKSGKIESVLVSNPAKSATRRGSHPRLPFLCSTFAAERLFVHNINTFQDYSLSPDLILPKCLWHGSWVMKNIGVTVELLPLELISIFLAFSWVFLSVPHQV